MRKVNVSPKILHGTAYCWGVLMVKQHKNGQKNIQKKKTQGALRNFHQLFGKILAVEVFDLAPNVS